MKKKDDNMTKKLYPIEEINAYIARKPSPEYDGFIRKQEETERDNKTKKDKEE